jgi:serine/threonine protein phosphatase PrpC
VQLLASGKTHAGRRTSNEDCFGIELDLGLFVVADGMGSAGEAASRLAVDTICAHFRLAGLGDPLIEFDAAIASAAQRIDRDERSQNMAATLAALSLFNQGATVAHVGDSRVYRLRHRRIERLTRDHSVVSDMEFALGHPILQRSSHPMGTVVTRALGGGGDARPDVRFLDVAAKDRFLLCSDGLTDSIVEPELRPLLARGTPDEASDYLMEQAIRNGARDNVTVIVVDVLRL